MIVMTEKDRYEYWEGSDTAYDTKRKYGQYFHIIDKKECVDLLNKKEEEITFLKSSNMELEDANARLEEKNIELQERNDRQYDILTHLWECIRNKDYETLQKEWEEIEETDKKLQEEWKCYE